MNFENNINGVVQQVKGILFDVISDIQVVISSLEIRLAENNDSGQQEQISFLLNQFRNQLSLILNNTSSLTNSIIDYEKLLDRAFLELNNGINETNAQVATSVITDEELNKVSVDNSANENRQVINEKAVDLSVADSDEAVDLPSVDLEKGKAVSNESSETVNLENQNTVAANENNDTDIAKKEEMPVVTEKQEVVTDDSSQVTNDPIKVVASIENNDTDIAKKEEMPVVTEKQEVVTDDSSQVTNDPIKVVASIENNDTDIAKKEEMPVVTEKQEAVTDDKQSEPTAVDAIVPFRIGDSNLETTQQGDSNITTLSEDKSNSGLIFLLGESTPRLIVVTSGQFSKLQNSCVSQAKALESILEVTDDNLEEMISNLPSLYEINPEEAEKLSEKITAKLQEIEKNME